MKRRAVTRLLALAPLVSACQPATQPVPAVAPLIVGQAPPPPPAERRVILTINFRLNSFEIDRSSLPLVANLAAALSDERLRGATFEVNGHTDASGRLAHNIALSFLRATAVVDSLHSRGVRHATIRAQGFGPLQLLHEAEPFSPGNRRVEVIAFG